MSQRSIGPKFSVNLGIMVPPIIFCQCLTFEFRDLLRYQGHHAVRERANSAHTTLFEGLERHTALWVGLGCCHHCACQICLGASLPPTVKHAGPPPGGPDYRCSGEPILQDFTEVLTVSQNTSRPRLQQRLCRSSTLVLKCPGSPRLQESFELIVAALNASKLHQRTRKNVF